MAKVIQLPVKKADRPEERHIVSAFTDVQDPEGTGNNCAVFAAVMEDSMGGLDQARLDHAIETCECDTCS